MLIAKRTSQAPKWMAGRQRTQVLVAAPLERTVVQPLVSVVLAASDGQLTTLATFARLPADSTLRRLQLNIHIFFKQLFHRINNN